MFRKRRQRDNSPAPAGADAGPVSPLIERLREIGQTSPTPEDALEPALRAVVEASGAGAGALCLFDPRYGVLRLTAESGLSDEGCRRLRNIRRGDPTSWDMPLHGVLNKRAYLIESAAKNRYVPPLVEQHASVRTVICVPVYSGALPLGTVVLIAMGSRTFTEADIRGLERPLREFGKLVEAVRRRVAPVLEAHPNLLGVPQDYSGVVEERDHLRTEMASRFAEHASLVSEVSARSQENDRLRQAIERLTEERARLQAAVEHGQSSTDRAEDLSEALAAAERERARLAAALEAAAVERSEAARRESALDSGRAEAQRIARETAAALEAARKAVAAAKMDAAAEIDERAAEVEQLRAYIAELEAAAERDRGVAHERQREHERVATELRAATAREQQLRAEMQGAVERLESGNADDVRQALAQARAAEEGRAEIQAEVESARSALAEQRSSFEALEAENARMRGELARLEATDASRRSEEHRLEASLANEQARARAAEARLAELERHATTLRESGDRTIADSRERAAELAAVSAHLESIAAERDRLREARATVESERDALMSELAASAAKVTRVEETLMREVAERERLAEALRVAQSALGALEGSRSERAPAVLEGRRVERPVPGGEPAQAPAEPARPRDTMRVLTVAPTGARANTRDGGAKRIAVIDVDPIWESASISGHEVVVVSPEEDTAGALAELEPSRVVVNLAAPGALEAVAALRGAGSESKVWGCIGLAGTDRAIPTGIVEVAARPLDCDAILDILKAHTSRGTRVVTAGADVDTLMSLRQAMARLGMSVSMAWDAKQATDLLTVVRPEVVVIDLDLPRQAGYGIVARLSVANPIPCAVIVPGKEDAAEAFAAALAQPGMGDLSVPRDRMLADAIGRQDAMAADHRLQKIRAVGRK
jgi:CheY-like chemotaxis protein